MLRADNCIGQNKNNAFIQYLMWRVAFVRHKSVQLSFLLAGHTKFTPDSWADPESIQTNTGRHNSKH